jgi:Tfp pilus assembly protein PilF
MAARAVLGLAALVAALWLGLSLRSAHLEQQAANVAVAGHASPAAVEQALGQLRSARAWQPDTQLKLLAWRLELKRGHVAQGNDLLRQVVASEPQNAEAWFYLSHTAQDPGLARTARRRFAELLRGG